MATWKSENSLLTQTGVEILNKIKAGVGKITVTRIVLGSGRVDSSLLYTQTKISGTQKEAILSSKITHETGSEISFHVTNEGYVSSFTVNQIGIFVTHPDYSGEQLYHISQCEDGTYDNIPAFSDTPVSFFYSLFLEHGNSSSVTITINSQGFLDIEAFENFRKNAVVGNLFTIDESRNLIDTGFSVASLRASSKNLLHNWYFRYPISTRMGRIALRGTPYYSDTGLTTQVGTLTTAYSATFVTGNYSTVVIGSTTYYVRTSSINYGYVASGTPCIDRWSMSRGSGDSRGYITYDSTGATILLGYNSNNFYQDVAPIAPPMHYGGRTYTFSAKIESFSGNGTPVLYFDNGETTYTLPITKTGILSLTVDVLEDAGALTVGLMNTSISQNSTVKVSAMKLEVGTESTLATDPPADYAEQMAICAQFDAGSGMYIGFTSLTTSNILAVAEIAE